MQNILTSPLKLKYFLWEDVFIEIYFSYGEYKYFLRKLTNIFQENIFQKKKMFLKKTFSLIE